MYIVSLMYQILVFSPIFVMDTKIICGHDNFVVTLTNKWCFRPYFILNDLMAKFYCDPF